MNKIALLKTLIGVITLLIFLSLGGIIYGLVNYKNTPKLLSAKKTAVTLPSVSKTQAQELLLPLAGSEQIADSHACGQMLCIRISSVFKKDKIIIIDPADPQVKATVIVVEKETTEK